MVFLSLLGVCGYYTLNEVNSKRQQEQIISFRQQRFLAAQNRPVRDGPGENGEPVVLTEGEQKIADTLFKNASFNVFASDKIALDRSIPDTRREE